MGGGAGVAGKREQVALFASSQIPWPGGCENTTHEQSTQGLEDED